MSDPYKAIIDQMDSDLKAAKETEKKREERMKGDFANPADRAAAQAQLDAAKKEREKLEKQREQVKKQSGQA